MDTYEEQEIVTARLEHGRLLRVFLAWRTMASSHKDERRQDEQNYDSGESAGIDSNDMYADPLLEDEIKDIILEFRRVSPPTILHLLIQHDCANRLPFMFLMINLKSYSFFR